MLHTSVVIVLFFFVQKRKTIFILRKIHKKLLHLEPFFLTQICIKSLVGCGFTQAPLGELTALPQNPSWFGEQIPQEGQQEVRCREVKIG